VPDGVAAYVGFEFERGERLGRTDPFLFT